MVAMACRSSFVSILNNDDHPSFAVRSTTQRHSDCYPYDPVRAPSPGSSVGSLDYAPSSCGSHFHSNPSESCEHRYSRASPVDPDPPSPQTSSSVSTSKQHSPSSSQRGIRKNKYPCPYATSHSCAATFTTSGHAARHGKKHTGEKSVLCPVCNKAFTRKDNMKQHIRTHRTHSEDMRQQQQQQQQAAGSEGGASPSGMSPYHHHHRKPST